ncbi:MAG: hypothetical protein ACJ8CG_17105, partial [Microvirga sp.]
MGQFSVEITRLPGSVPGGNQQFNPQTGTTTRSANSLTLLGIKSGSDKAFMTGIHPEDRQKVQSF